MITYANDTLCTFHSRHRYFNVTSWNSLLLFVDDDVYLKQEDERKEFVLKQNGCVFTGTSTHPNINHWYYGQVRFHGNLQIYTL